MDHAAICPKIPDDGHSRAKALALVFGAPRLPDSKCETLEQMRMVNALATLTEFVSGK